MDDSSCGIIIVLGIVALVIAAFVIQLFIEFWWICFPILAIAILIGLLIFKSNKKKEIERNKYPLLYSSETRSYNFESRISDSYKSIQAMRNMKDFVGANEVITKLQDCITFVDQKLRDESYNALLVANPTEIEEAARKIDKRLSVAEKSLKVLARAFTEQEIGIDKNRLTEIVSEAERILENQTKSDTVLMQKVDQMQKESKPDFRQEENQLQSENESNMNQTLMQ